MKTRANAKDETLPLLACKAAARWLLPLGIMGLLVSGEIVGDGHPVAQDGPLPSAALAQSPLVVSLPEPRLRAPMSLEESLRQRRSVRAFDAESLSLGDVSQLLWAGQGVTGPDGARTAPSAGALYPLDMFLVVGEVRGLDPGVYRYQPATHDLGMIAEGDRRAPLCSAALNQAWVASAPAAIVITGTYERTTRKYGERGLRYVHMEAGCAAQSISLAATALGLGTVVVGAFEDRKVGAALDLPEKAEALCILPVGLPG